MLQNGLHAVNACKSRFHPALPETVLPFGPQDWYPSAPKCGRVSPRLSVGIQNLLRDCRQKAAPERLPFL
jgi:hypothetical protein